MTDHIEPAPDRNVEAFPDGEVFSVRMPWTWVNPISASAGESMVPVKLNSPAAKAFAALHLVDDDLAFASECLSKADALGRPNNSILESKAFIFAGVMAYARCFGLGVRVVKLDSNALVVFGQGFDIATHEYLLALRNKHVAHSVNDFEESGAIGVLYGMFPATLRDGGAIGVSVKQSIGISRAILRKAIANIESARAYVAADLEVRRAAIYEEFKEAIEKGVQFEVAPLARPTNRSNVAERRLK